MDFPAVNQALDAIVKMYEHKLKELNPSVRNITYDISDLNNFLDSLQDVCALVWVNCSHPVCIPIHPCIYQSIYYDLSSTLLTFLVPCWFMSNQSINQSIVSTPQTTSTSLTIELGWRRRYYSISRVMLVPANRDDDVWRMMMMIMIVIMDDDLPAVQQHQHLCAVSYDMM